MLEPKQFSGALPKFSCQHRHTLWNGVITLKPSAVAKWAEMGKKEGAAAWIFVVFVLVKSEQKHVRERKTLLTLLSYVKSLTF